jgi:hypothetical protein
LAASTPTPRMSRTISVRRCPPSLARAQAKRGRRNRRRRDWGRRDRRSEGTRFGCLCAQQFPECHGYPHAVRGRAVYDVGVQATAGPRLRVGSRRRLLPLGFLLRARRTAATTDSSAPTRPTSAFHAWARIGSFIRLRSSTRTAAATIGHSRSRRARGVRRTNPAHRAARCTPARSAHTPPDTAPPPRRSDPAHPTPPRSPLDPRSPAASASARETP